MRYIPIFLFLFAGVLNAQFVNFIRLDSHGTGDFSFTVYNFRFTIGTDGRGQIETGRKKVSSLRLSIPKNCLIQKIQYAQNTKDIYITCEYRDSDIAAGFIICYDLTSFKMKWRARIPGLNIGEPLYDRMNLYLTCAGWAGKLNTFTGTFEWQKGKLNRNDGSFTSFDKPYLEGENVVFKESIASASQRNSTQPLMITLDDIRGKIIKDK